MEFRYSLSYQLTKIIRCSHKQAVDFCRKGIVMVNGQVETNPRKKIGSYESIIVNNEQVRAGITLKYVLFYKPNLYECTSNRAIENNIYEILPLPYQELFPLGRLDKNSEGLLVLTNDGQYYREMMGQEAQIEKEYLVHTYQPISQSLKDSFLMPFQLGKRLTQPALLEQLDNFSFKVILKEGINRHIRRICAKNNNQVKQLIRIRFGDLNLEDLKEGEWKEISKF
jgi:23S rRNA pseudouridine2604 synthase